MINTCLFLFTTLKLKKKKHNSVTNFYLDKSDRLKNLLIKKMVNNTTSLVTSRSISRKLKEKKNLIYLQ